jgi:hypothetical protein
MIDPEVAASNTITAKELKARLIFSAFIAAL